MAIYKGKGERTRMAKYRSILIQNSVAKHHSAFLRTKLMDVLGAAALAAPVEVLPGLKLSGKCADPSVWRALRCRVVLMKDSATRHTALSRARPTRGDATRGGLARRSFPVMFAAVSCDHVTVLSATCTQRVKPRRFITEWTWMLA